MILSNFVAVILASLLSSGVPSSLEISMNNGKMTIDVRNMELVAVLDEMAKQGSFKVTPLEPAELRGILISETFVDLPIKQGIDRLLTPWNFSYTTSSKTGVIKEIFLVSKKGGGGGARPILQKVSPKINTETVVRRPDIAENSHPNVPQHFPISPETREAPQEEAGLPALDGEDEGIPQSQENLSYAKEEYDESPIENLSPGPDEMP